MDRSALPTPDCAPVRELLAAAVDGPLSLADRRHADQHLSTCAACRRVERGLTMDAASMMRLPTFDAPTRVGRRIHQERRRRSGAGPAVAAAFLALALVVVVGGGWTRFLTGPAATAGPPTTPSSSSLESASVPPPSSTPGGTATAAATPDLSDDPSPRAPSASTAAQLTGRLSRVAAPALDGDAAVWAIVPWEGGAVAVGRRCDTPSGAPRPCVATAWRTDDLASGVWTEDAVNVPSPNADGVAIVGLAASADRLVAVGHARLGADHVPLIWTSTDAETWQRIDAPAGVVHGWVSSVVAGPDGFVAVGSEIRRDQSQATVWGSADGVTWTIETSPPLDGGLRAATPLAPDTRRLAFGGMQDVTLRPDGTAVAVGARCRPDPEHCHPRAWVRQVDGAWTAVDLGDEMTDLGELDAVTTLGARTIAVGSDRAGRPIAIYTDDLARWRPMVVPPDTGDGATGFTEAVALGDAVIAFTSDGDDLAVWTWMAGVGWERIGDDGPAGRTIFGGAVVDGRLVLGGRRADGAALWLADEVTG